MKHRRFACLVAAAISALLITAGLRAGSTDTIFTYQGELKEGGSPANGSFDMDFSLWSALVGGVPVGDPIALTNVSVSDGRFTVELDFGAETFDNTARWLQIAVEGITLSPRQPITRAPYSIQTRGIFVDDAERVGIGTTAPEGSLHVREGSAGVITANPNAVLVLEDSNPAFINVLTSDASESGILFGRPGSFVPNAMAGLVCNSPANPDGLQLRTGGNQTRMVIDTAGDVGIGTTAPLYRLHVESNIGGEPAVYVESATSIGVWGKGGSTGVQGEATESTGLNYGVRGVSDSPSGFDFYADGAGTDYGSSSSVRWKRNLEPLNDPLTMVAQLRGVYFDWDAEHGGHHDVGMIAEEVGEVLPEIVTYEDNGIDANGMDYSRLTPLLVEAVKALRAEKDAEIDALRAEKDAEIAELRTSINELRSLIARLSAQISAK